MGKYALVTGASRGIGRAIAMRLSSDGYTVIINYRSGREAAEQTLSDIRLNGGDAELLPFDVSDVQAVDSAIDRWEAEHPGEYISVLVNNAGIRDDALMVFMADDQWSRVISTNLDSMFFVTRRILKNMLVKRSGRIVNISSFSGLRGLPGQTNYSAAKGALIAATRSLAQEIAPRKITVNAVAPGYISTDMTSGLDEASLKQQVPMKRFGKPEEVAALVSFLVSDQASYITGEVIAVSGGM